MQNNNYQHYSDDIYSQTIFNFARLNICTASYQYSGREPYMHGHRDHIDKEMFLSTQGREAECNTMAVNFVYCIKLHFATPSVHTHWVVPCSYGIHY